MADYWFVIQDNPKYQHKYNHSFRACGVRKTYSLKEQPHSKHYGMLILPSSVVTGDTKTLNVNISVTDVRKSVVSSHQVVTESGWLICTHHHLHHDQSVVFLSA